MVDRTNDGRRLNCPNGITVRNDGHIYFTDPFWNFGDGRGGERQVPGARTGIVSNGGFGYGCLLLTTED